MEFLFRLFTVDSLLHEDHYLWKSEIAWLHTISDGLIALAYFYIPVIMVYVVRKRRDLPFHWMFLMLGLFILGCGTTHLLEALTLWHDTHGLIGLIKAMTALASLVLAVFLVPLVPVALVLPGPAQLRAVNRTLEKEIRERRRAEAELQRSKAYLAEVQRLSHTGSWALNLSTGDLYWSQEHFRIFGLDPDKVKPSYEMFFKLVHPEDQPVLKRDFDKAIQSGSDFESDYRIVLPDGMVRYIHSISHPIFNESGDLTEYVGTVIDTTERKQAEESLKNAHAELAHATRVATLGEMTASIAHEINQPLSAIVTNGNACLRLLSHGELYRGEVREIVECMINDSMRASDVIRRARMLLKKSAPEKAPLNLNEAIREAIALVAGELNENKVQLRTELEADLPQVLGDRVQLQQVVLNLILNGNEAMSRVEWQPRELLISSQGSRSDQVLVKIKDSGTGIDPRYSEHLFEAFFTTKEAGLGLGLTISRTIIETHGGRLWVTPNEGHGATFQFTVPTSYESRV